MTFKQKLFFILASFFIILSIYISAHKPFWRDEIFSVYLGNQTLLQMIRSTSKDFSPPLFYFPLHFFVKIFNHQPIFLRLLPLGFSLAALFVFTLIIDFFKLKKDQAIMALATITFSFPLIYYSLELRPYSALMFFSSLSLFFFLKSFAQPQVKWPIWHCLTNILLLYTHNVAIIFILCQAFTAFLYHLFRPIKAKNFRNIFLSFVFSLFIYLPWLNIVFKQSQQARNSFWIDLNKQEMLQEYLGLYYIIEHLSGDIKKLTILKHFFRLSLFLTAAGILAFLTQFKNKILFPFVFIFTLIAFYGFSIKFSPVLYQRYIAFLAPLASFFLAFTFIYLNQKNKILSYLLCLSYLFFSARITYYFLMKRPAKTDYSLLQNFSLPVYTLEFEELLPCTFYAHSCTFIGKLSDIPTYVGISQLNPSLFKTTPDWQTVSDKHFYILYNWELDSKSRNYLLTQYHKLSAMDLGDNIWIEEYILN